MKKQNKRGTTRAKNDKQKTYEMKCVNSGIFEEQGKILMFILDELDEGSQRANLRQTQIVYWSRIHVHRSHHVLVDSQGL